MAFDYILSIEAMIYFMGSYAFGMIVGAHIDDTLQLFEKLKIWTWGIALLSTATLWYLLNEEINMIGFTSLQETFFYIQKTALTC